MKKESAKRDTKIGGYHYKGYYFHKPEGCTSWNIHNIDKNGNIDFCFAECYADSFNECKGTIDEIVNSR